MDWIEDVKTPEMDPNPLRGEFAIGDNPKGMAICSQIAAQNVKVVGLTDIRFSGPLLNDHVVLDVE
ncbi:hypothetical protein [Microvirga sp. Mcv34]|uniref:hypothetical protein n=1 Tax=Microvirga sp. Mcv34 TaxID=2926016 RepID=UPI0021CA2DAB|nr:hypothetical protein [Microvirga sp. Mcv34]